jgi:hypothetical protein
MFSKIIIAVASMASLAITAPAAPAQPAHFTLQAIHSGDLHVHQQLINFNHDVWAIGLPTVAPCLYSDKTACSSGKNIDQFQQVNIRAD